MAAKKYRLRKGKRPVIMAGLAHPSSGQHVWVFVQRGDTERSGKPHLQLVARRNLEIVE